MTRQLNYEKLRSAMNDIFARKADSGVSINRNDRYNILRNMGYDKDGIIEDTLYMYKSIMQSIYEDNEDKKLGIANIGNQKRLCLRVICDYTEPQEALLREYFPTSEIKISTIKSEQNYASIYLTFKISDEDMVLNKNAIDNYKQYQNNLWTSVYDFDIELGQD